MGKDMGPKERALREMREAKAQAAAKPAKTTKGTDGKAPARKRAKKR